MERGRGVNDPNRETKAGAPVSYDALIVCGGEIDIPFLSSVLAGSPDAEKIAADRGLAAFEALGVTPDLLLGDYDSADPDLVAKWKEEGRAMRIYPAEKDFSDAEAAVRYVAEKYGSREAAEPGRGAAWADRSSDRTDPAADRPSRAALLGATGGRLDHFLANVQLLQTALEAGVVLEILDPCNRIRLIDKATVLRRGEAFGRYVSVLPYTDTVSGVTLRGFRYPLTDAELRKGSSLTVSNEFAEEEASVELKSGQLLLLETRDR